MVYIPEDIVDMIVYHSVEVNARSHMRDRVLPDFMSIVDSFIMFRCDQCAKEGVICVNCAHDYGYVTGPGHYCGKKYIVNDMLNTDQLPNYMDNLTMWANGMDIDIYIGGEIGEDIHSLTLQYKRDKYKNGTLGNMIFEGRLLGIENYLMIELIEMYHCFFPKNIEIDTSNIRSYCRAKDIMDDFDLILGLWVRCMYGR